MNNPFTMEETSRLCSIWYQLVDSATGEPYMGAGADQVSVPLNANVVKFRKAVQGENSAILMKTTSSQLVVYENKAAFDKRKSVGGKVEPLEEDSLVSDLGAKKADALIVVVPTISLSPNEALGNTNNISAELFSALTAPFPTEPNLQELHGILRQDPLVQIPINPYTYNALAEILPSKYFLKQKIFRSSPVESCMMDGTLLSIAELKVQTSFGGEAVLHHYIDTLIKDVLLKLFSFWPDNIVMEAGRDATDPSNTTEPRSRPDFLLYMNQFLILRGEEKMINTMLTTAQNELVKKLKAWNVPTFGNLRYIFGFACAGAHLTFCAMSPATELTIISPILDMGNVENRFQILVAVINLARLFRTLAHRIPQGTPIMYRRIERPNGNIIEIQDFYVLKKVPVPTHEFKRTIRYLKTLYATMRRENVPHVIELSEISPSTKAPDQKQYIALKLKPCGLQIIPNSLNSLISALRCIFQALEAIHGLGYAHRDVRWPNVLCVADEDWRLIDFENSSLGDSTLQKKDLHMVGDMMSQCISIFTSSNLLCSLHNQLRTQSPPSASEALRILNDIPLDVNIE